MMAMMAGFLRRDRPVMSVLISDDFNLKQLAHFRKYSRTMKTG